MINPNLPGSTEHVTEVLAGDGSSVLERLPHGVTSLPKFVIEVSVGLLEETLDGHIDKGVEDVRETSLGLQSRFQTIGLSGDLACDVPVGNGNESIQ